MPSENRPHASEHLQMAERLGEIIVGAYFQTLYLVNLGVSRGQDHNGRVGYITKLREDLKAIHVGKPDVQNDDIRGFFSGKLNAFLSRVCLQHHAIRPAQVKADSDNLADVRFVIN